MASEMDVLTISENSWENDFYDTLPVNDPSERGLGFDFRFSMQARSGTLEYFRLTCDQRARPEEKASFRRRLESAPNQKDR
jgi:hypothetical protein